MPFIQLPAGAIFYECMGSGMPLFLLHGWGGSSRSWHYTIRALAPHYTVYAFDLPGYGNSPPIATVASPMSMAHVIVTCAAILGVPAFHLNGHSFSAAVAATIAATYPAYVRSLTLTCPATFRNQFEHRILVHIHRITGVWLWLRKPWMNGKLWLYRLLARPFFHRIPSNQMLLRLAFDDFFRMDFTTALASAVQAVDAHYNHTLQHIVAPTLVVGARQDHVMPHYGASEVARHIPHSNVVWIDACGHLPMLEQPDTYHRTLQEFLHHA